MLPRNPKRYDSQRKGNARYNKANITTIGIGVKLHERELYEKYTAIYSIPLSQFFRKCAIYCIRNGIDISNVNLDITDLTDGGMEEKGE